MQNFPCDCTVDAAKIILEALCRERNRDETCVDTEMSRRFVDGEGACRYIPLKTNENGGMKCGKRAKSENKAGNIC